MRDNDDDGPRHDSGSLADGLGETVGDDPFGDGGFGDGDLEPGGGGADRGAEGGETSSGAEGADDDVTDGSGGSAGVGGLDADGLQAQSVSPLEGLGYIFGEVRDALFGEDDAGDADGLLHHDPALSGDLDPSDDAGVIDA